jgi:hypothetical protein
LIVFIQNDEKSTNFFGGKVAPAEFAPDLVAAKSGFFRIIRIPLLPRERV